MDSDVMRATKLFPWTTVLRLASCYGMGLRPDESHRRAKGSGYLAVLYVLISAAIGFADILYVPSPYETIQEAIDQSSPNDTVLVLPGNYFEQLVIEDHGITLAGEFLLNGDTLTVGSALIHGTLGARPLTVLPSVQEPVFVTGLCFLDGHIEVPDNGGGILAVGVEIYLERSIIRNNYAFQVGGAHLDSCIGFIRNNLFRENTSLSSCGAFVASDGEYEITGNTFMLNQSGWTTGAVFLSHGTGSFIENTVLYNMSPFVGGGLYLLGTGDDEAPATWTVFNNIIRGNHSGDGGGIYVVGNMNVTIAGNLFDSNVATMANNGTGTGGGLTISYYTAEVIIQGNMFRNNIAGYAAGAAELRYDCSVVNNIFMNNSAPRCAACESWGQQNNHYTNVEAHHNLFYENTAVDTVGIDYHGAVKARTWSGFELIQNDFKDNSPLAAGIADNENENDLIVENNYWGHPTGPYHEEQNPEGQGDTVMVELDIIPYATHSFTDFRSPGNFSLVYPPDDVNNEILPLHFSWEPAVDPNTDDTLRYRLELSLTEEFDSVLCWAGAGTDTSVDVFPEDLETSYYWRVIVRDNIWLETISNETNILHVTSQGLVPLPFNLGLPEAEGVIESLPLTFTWYPSIDYTVDDTVSYVLELAEENNFNNSVRHFAGTDTFITVEVLDWENVYYWRVFADDLAGHRTFSNEVRCFHLTVVPDHDSSLVPSAWQLSEPYPNPFNPVVSVVVGVPNPAGLTVEIYDLLGRRLDVLFSGRMRPGYHRLQWWTESASGIYILHLKSDSGWESSKKLLLVK